MESTTSKTRQGAGIGVTSPNPVGSTSEFLPEYLDRIHGLDAKKGGFDQAKTGVFVPGFDPLDFERKCTLLFPEIEVRCKGTPDNRNFDGKTEFEREYSLFYSTNKGNLPVIHVGGCEHGKDRPQ
jgi:hypothetical protein